MGKWAKKLFGRDNIGDVGIVLAGTLQPDREKEILSIFDEVLSSKDSVYHAHLVRKGQRTLPLVTNVYGAPALLDVMAEMYDGGCRNLLFIGYAYGFGDIEVSSVVVPVISYHQEGLFEGSDKPDPELQETVKQVLDAGGMKYITGTNITVPSVTYQPLHKSYEDVNPTTVEMELAACFARGKEIGMRTSGILIISDTRRSSIYDHVNKDATRVMLFKMVDLITGNLNKFSFPLLPMQFSIDKHLAAIIDDPEDVTNIYRQK